MDPVVAERDARGEPRAQLSGIAPGRLRPDGRMLPRWSMRRFLQWSAHAGSRAVTAAPGTGGWRGSVSDDGAVDREAAGVAPGGLERGRSSLPSASARAILGPLCTSTSTDPFSPTPPACSDERRARGVLPGLPGLVREAAPLPGRLSGGDQMVREGDAWHPAYGCGTGDDGSRRDRAAARRRARRVRTAESAARPAQPRRSRPLATATMCRRCGSCGTSGSKVPAAGPGAPRRPLMIIGCIRVGPGARRCCVSLTASSSRSGSLIADSAPEPDLGRCPAHRAAIVAALPRRPRLHSCSRFATTRTRPRSWPRSCPASCSGWDGTLRRGGGRRALTGDVAWDVLDETFGMVVEVTPEMAAGAREARRPRRIRRPRFRRGERRPAAAGTRLHPAARHRGALSGPGESRSTCSARTPGSGPGLRSAARHRTCDTRCWSGTIAWTTRSPSCGRSPAAGTATVPAPVACWTRLPSVVFTGYLADGAQALGLREVDPSQAGAPDRPSAGFGSPPIRTCATSRLTSWSPPWLGASPCS